MKSNYMSADKTSRLAPVLLTAALYALIGPAWSASISASAFDKSGAPMPEVVIYATPVGAHPPIPPTSESLVIAQQGMQFSPYVTPLRVGSKISFPNKDKMLHHVKSFSPAKEFEFKVYDKVTPPAVTFDKAGVVIIYCILHDWMRAYVLVLDTPYFSKTAATGTVTLSGLPEATYEIRAWHPDMGTIKPALLQTVKVTESGATPIKFDFGFIPRKRRATN